MIKAHLAQHATLGMCHMFVGLTGTWSCHTLLVTDAWSLHPILEIIGCMVVTPCHLYECTITPPCLPYRAQLGATSFHIFVCIPLKSISPNPPYPCLGLSLVLYVLHILCNPHSTKRRALQGKGIFSCSLNLSFRTFKSSCMTGWAMLEPSWVSSCDLDVNQGIYFIKKKLA